MVSRFDTQGGILNDCELDEVVPIPEYAANVEGATKNEIGSRYQENLSAKLRRQSHRTVGVVAVVRADGRSESRFQPKIKNALEHDIGRTDGNENRIDSDFKLG